MHVVPEVEPVIKEEFEKKGYRFFGYGAVQICSWTKKAILKQGVCYKQKFYGVPTHRCMEFSPAAVFCHNNCIYCWRPTEWMKPPKNIEWQKPEEMVEALIEARKKLLAGFWGNEKADRQLLKEAVEPVHFAISLSGEPTLYPYLPELVKYLQKRPGTFSIFLVTNGLEPDMLYRLWKEWALPTQIYLSMNAWEPELYRKIHVPAVKDAWQRFLRSVDFISQVPTRTVLRLTIIRGYNDEIEKFAEIVSRANAHFLEVKSYMHLGYSQHRLPKTAMLEHEEIVKLAERLEEVTDYEYMDEQEASRIVVLKNKKRRTERFIKGPRPEDNGFRFTPPPELHQNRNLS